MSILKNEIAKKRGKSMALVSPRRLGKTAIMERFYNRLYRERDDVMPFYYELGESKIDFRTFSEEYYLGFLRQCISKIKLIEFIDIKTDTGFLAIRSGSFDVVDDDLFRQNLVEETLREIVTLLAPDLLPE